MTVTLRKLLEERADVWSRFSDIGKAAESRSLTPAERDEFNRLEPRLQVLALEIEDEKRRMAEGEDAAAGSAAIGPAGYGRSTFDTDRDGRAVAGRPLTRSQSMESYVRARSLPTDAETRAPLDFDLYVRGLLTGEWDGAENERRAMSEGTTTAGGYLVPTLLSAQIIDLARAQSVVMQAGAQVVPMESQKVVVPKWTGDPTAAWRTEASTITPSDGTLGKVDLTAQSLASLVVASRELLEDAPQVQSRLALAFAKAFALKVDLAALIGSGTAPEPRGIKSTSGITTTSLGVNGATPTWDNLIDGIGVLDDLNEDPNAAIWAPRVGRSLAKAKEATTNAYLKPPAFVTDRLTTFASTQLPTNLTQGTSTDCADIIIGDFAQLFVGIRTQLMIMPLTERYADSASIGFLAWWRGDVAVARPGAFNVLTGARP